MYIESERRDASAWPPDRDKWGQHYCLYYTAFDCFLVILFIQFYCFIYKSMFAGVTANFIFFDRDYFRVLQLTYFYLSKSARAYLFQQSVKIDYFCSGPISVDPTTKALPAASAGGAPGPGLPAGQGSALANRVLSPTGT